MPRSVVSGFIATLASASAFVVSYGTALVGRWIGSADTGTGAFGDWMSGLASNRVLDLAAAGLPFAIAAHLVIGVGWALAYARYAESRLRGPHWLRGATFALAPWAVSQTIILPLVGGGLFGSAMGAGPLPALGSLLLHLGYGVVLGLMYGPLGDLPALTESRDETVDEQSLAIHYQEGAARGILLGAIAGSAAGGVLTMAAGSATILGASPVLLVPVAMAIGASFGSFWGSLEGMLAPAPA